MKVGERCVERHDSYSLQVRGGEVLVERAQVVHGEGQAQQVDQDPEEVQDIMPIRSLREINCL